MMTGVSNHLQHHIISTYIKNVKSEYWKSPYLTSYLLTYVSIIILSNFWYPCNYFNSMELTSTMKLRPAKYTCFNFKNKPAARQLSFFLNLWLPKQILMTSSVMSLWIPSHLFKIWFKCGFRDSCRI